MVHAGEVAQQYGKILYEAHDERELADYHALTGSFERSDVAKLVADARKFVEKMQKLLKA